MKKRLLAAIVVLSVLFSVFTAPTMEASAKTKKTKKAKTTVSEEAAHFTVDTWTPTYGNWTKKQIEKADVRGTGKNIFDKTEKFYETSLFNNKKFRQTCATIEVLTGRGHYGVLEDQKGEIVKYLQKNIKTVTDVWSYLYLTNYSYLEDDQGYMSFVIGGWNVTNNAIVNITDNCGICIETACVVCYLLEDDYDEVGTIMVTSDYGHAYNYVKSDGLYYLIDFTDFTSSDHAGNSTSALQNEYNNWVDNICFWSGDSLNSASCTKAVLVHDTYDKDNVREHFDMDFNEKHTAVINAIRYYSGNLGSAVSDCQDVCYQSGYLKDKTWMSGWINGKKTNFMPSFVGFSFPEYTWYQTLYVNSTEKFCNAAWKELPPTELKLVPWFVDLSTEAQAIVDSQETYTEKMLRQTEYSQGKDVPKINCGGGNSCGGKTSEYDIISIFNPEVKWGLLQAVSQYINPFDLTDDNNGDTVIKSWLDNMSETLKTKYYGVEIIKIK